MANVICADGTMYEKGDISVAVLQEIVGGDLKSVSLADGRIMLSNEDGASLGLPFNIHATHLLHEAGAEFWEKISGDVVICRRGEIG